MRRTAPRLTALLVLLLTCSLLGARPAREAPPWLLTAARRSEEFRAPAAMGLRDLRRLPGVGEGRARAILRARRRWEDGPRAAPLTWVDVPGVGPVTSEAIRRWFASRGRDPEGLLGRP